MTERATEDKTLVKTLVRTEPQRHFDSTISKKKSTQFSVVFYEDNITVPKNLKIKVITPLYKRHRALIDLFLEDCEESKKLFKKYMQKVGEKSKLFPSTGKTSLLSLINVKKKQKSISAY